MQTVINETLSGMLVSHRMGNAHKILIRRMCCSHSNYRNDDIFRV